jgi:hypothetical protein
MLFLYMQFAVSSATQACESGYQSSKKPTAELLGGKDVSSQNF